MVGAYNMSRRGTGCSPPPTRVNPRVFELNEGDGAVTSG